MGSGFVTSLFFLALQKWKRRGYFRHENFLGWREVGRYVGGYIVLISVVYFRGHVELSLSRGLECRIDKEGKEKRFLEVYDIGRFLRTPSIY